MDHFLAFPSSSSAHKTQQYDVFLSFRGEDTRRNFTGHLYRALQHKGIQTFIDNEELRIGEEISPSLTEAIRGSKISIIIFSKNYASSSWCLDELVEILDCRDSLGQLVWPVFFDVDPSDVRNHRGSFGEALAKYEEIFNKKKEKLPNWKIALNKASNLSGWHLANGDESQLIQRIAEAALTKLNRTLLYVAKYPVGIEDCLQEFESVIEVGNRKNDVRLIGIYGIGGVGKTTIAKAVFNKFSDEFEGSSFLANVRETSKQHLGMVQLQEMLLFDMLGDRNIKVGNTHRGINIVRNRLCHKKVLVILDNVDELEQLQTLAGGHDWFGPGSRIIITTRNKHFLTTHGANQIYKVRGLDHKKALELLSWNAFKRNEPLEDYLTLSNCVVDYTSGLPLALEVLGSFLYGRTKHQWQSAIHNLEKKQDKKLYEILKISYDALQDHEKALFLDIACFFVGEDKNYVIKVLGSSKFCPIIGIEVLIDLSLLNIKENTLRMHNLIEEMGKEIVRQESSEPGKRSRLWSPDDICHVLSENTGTQSVEGIVLKFPEQRTLHLNANSFENIKRLRLLIFQNAVLSTSIGYLSNELTFIDLPAYQFPTLPFNCGSKQLIILNMPRSHIHRLDIGFKNFERLEVLNFSHSKLLSEIPDLSTAPNLQSLYFDHCTSLVEIHESVGFLTKLRTLNIENCSNLSIFPRNLVSKYLRKFVLRGCSRLKNFPNIVEKMKFLTSLDLCGTAITELPSSIELIVRLQELWLNPCAELMHIPASIYKLLCLEVLDIGSCRKLIKFPKYADELKAQLQLVLLRYLKLKSCNLSEADFLMNSVHFPSPQCSDKLLFLSLRYLKLKSCNLSEVDFLANPACFPLLQFLDLSYNKFVTLPFFHSSTLELLDLSNNKFLVSLPSFGDLPELSYLSVSNCELLEEIPELPDTRQINVNAIDCKSLVKTPCKIMAKLISNDRGFLRDCETEATLSGLEVPEWFSHKLEEPRTFNESSNIDIRGWFSYKIVEDDITFNLPPNMLKNMSAVIFCAVFESASERLELTFKLLDGSDSPIGSITRQKLSTKSGNMWLFYLPIKSLVHCCLPCSPFMDCNKTSGGHLKDVRKIRVKFFACWGKYSTKLVSSCGIHIVQDQDELKIDHKQIKVPHISHRYHPIPHLMKRSFDDFADRDIEYAWRLWLLRKRRRTRR